MFTTVCQSFVGWTRIIWLGILLAVPLYAQDSPSKVSGQVMTPATAETDSTRAPLVLTLQDALARAKANDPQFRAVLTDLGVAHLTPYKAARNCCQTSTTTCSTSTRRGTVPPPDASWPTTGSTNTSRRAMFIRRFHRECSPNIERPQRPRRWRAPNRKLQHAVWSSPSCRLITATSWHSASMRPRRRRLRRRTTFLVSAKSCRTAARSRGPP